MVHLDTNFLIKAIRPGSSEDAKLGSWLAAGESLGISSIAWAEFFAGPLSKADELVARQMFGAVEGLSGGDAEVAAQLFNQTGRRSRSLPDCMIAAIAIRCRAKLATLNTSDFQLFVQHGLILA
ncbi:MAG TPA: PIN domain-containing protein [Verrucomicrobiae bacterium]|nr:PIN domain-containing protein [Verrucomicrobiae bacterium]